MAGKEELSPLEDVIAELNSGYGVSISGPLKEINGLKLEHATIDAPNNRLTACIGIEAFRQDLYGAMSDTQRDFTVTLDVLRSLAAEAPRLRVPFSKLFNELSQDFARECAAYQEGVVAWCDAGLPVQQPTVLMKPLRWKIGPAR